MTYLLTWKEGQLVLPSSLLFHVQEIFGSSDDFLIWQFFYLQNSSQTKDLTEEDIARSTGKTLLEVNRAMSNLTEKGLLKYQTIELNGEIEVIFDAFPAFEQLDQLLAAKEKAKESQNELGVLVKTFNEEWGRLLSPTEAEKVGKFLMEDGFSAELIRAALKESVLNGKNNLNYVHAILRNWSGEGIRTLAQVEAKKREREAVNPQNVTVSNDFLESMDLWK